MTMSKTVPSVALAAFVAAAIPARGADAARPVAEFRNSAAGCALDEQNRDQDREEQTDRQTKTFKLGADGELSLGNVAGDIVVTRGQRRTRRRWKSSRLRAAAPPTTRGQCSAWSTSTSPNAAVAPK